MKLDYGTQLSPTPIKLSIGTLKKPKLIEISEIGFDRFSVFESFSKMTPERFYTVVKGDKGKEVWDSMSDDDREKLTMHSMIKENDSLQQIYTALFDFFFIESVIYKEGYFILLTDYISSDDNISEEHIRGVINEQSFSQILELIQQICCIYEKEEDINTLKFKNNIARRMYEKMLKAQKAEKAQKKADPNLSLPNIISAVSNRHPTINPICVWDLTLFQLYDAFSRLQVNVAHNISSTRVSVWGDEKNTFNIALWYKNEYDKK